MSQPSWCVVISKPMCEEIAATAILKAGYRSYLPRQSKTLTGHRSGRGEIVMRPLFSRYLFAELHPSQQWSPLKRATGVCDLIWWGNKPALLGLAIIEAMREAENDGLFDRINRPSMPLNAQVRVIRPGPYKDLIGRVVECDDEQKRVVVLLGILGGASAPFAGAELEVVSA